MKQIFDQLLKFLQQGIAWTFHFIELVWTWSVEQVSKLMAVPWQDWLLWKQLLLVLIVAGVIWALYGASTRLLRAGAVVLAAFAGLLGALVQTLPHVFLAGVIALGGVWLVNHLDKFLSADSELDAGLPTEQLIAGSSQVVPLGTTFAIDAI
jgi:hypothetical protein